MPFTARPARHPALTESYRRPRRLRTRPSPHIVSLSRATRISRISRRREARARALHTHTHCGRTHHVRHHRVHVRARRGTRTGWHRDTPRSLSAVRCQPCTQPRTHRTRPRRSSPPAPRPATGPRPRPPCVQRQPGGGADPRQWPEAPRVPRLRLGGRGPRVDRGPLRQGGQEDREWLAPPCVCVCGARGRARPRAGSPRRLPSGARRPATPLPSHPASPLVPRARARPPLGLARRARWPTWRARARACH